MGYAARRGDRRSEMRRAVRDVVVAARLTNERAADEQEGATSASA